METEKKGHAKKGRLIMIKKREGVTAKSERINMIEREKNKQEINVCIYLFFRQNNKNLHYVFTMK